MNAKLTLEITNKQMTKSNHSTTKVSLCFVLPIF